MKTITSENHEFTPFLKPFLGQSLTSVQSQAEKALQLRAYPHRKQEEWKYTDVSSLKSWDFQKESMKALGGLQGLSSLLGEGWRQSFSGVVLFENGACTHKDLDDSCPVEVLALSADESEFTPEDRNESVFSLLNKSRPAQGFVLKLGSSLKVEKPLLVLHRSEAEGESATLSSRRHRVVLGPGSSMSIVDWHLSRGGGDLLVNSLMEAKLEGSARLNYLKVQDESEQTYHLASADVSLQQGAQADVVSVMLGARVARQEFNMEVMGANAEAQIGGAYLGRGRQHLDHQVNVRHLSEDSLSRQLFKGVLTESSRAVFKGGIYIAPQAQRVDSDQLNQTLVLSRKAEMDSQPELEVYADDVKATHGATIGQLDDEEIFYLQSRGLNRDLATQLVASGYLTDVLEKLRDENLRRWALSFFSKWWQSNEIDLKGDL